MAQITQEQLLQLRDKIKDADVDTLDPEYLYGAMDSLSYLWAFLGSGEFPAASQYRATNSRWAELLKAIE